MQSDYFDLSADKLKDLAAAGFDIDAPGEFLSAAVAKAEAEKTEDELAREVRKHFEDDADVVSNDMAVLAAGVTPAQAFVALMSQQYPDVAARLGEILTGQSAKEGRAIFSHALSLLGSTDGTVLFGREPVTKDICSLPVTALEMALARRGNRVVSFMLPSEATKTFFVTMQNHILECRIHKGGLMMTIKDFGDVYIPTLEKPDAEKIKQYASIMTAVTGVSWSTIDPLYEAICAILIILEPLKLVDGKAGSSFVSLIHTKADREKLRRRYPFYFDKEVLKPSVLNTLRVFQAKLGLKTVPHGEEKHMLKQVCAHLVRVDGFKELGIWFHEFARKFHPDRQVVINEHTALLNRVISWEKPVEALNGAPADVFGDNNINKNNFTNSDLMKFDPTATLQTLAGDREFNAPGDRDRTVDVLTQNSTFADPRIGMCNKAVACQRAFIKAGVKPDNVLGGKTVVIGVHSGHDRSMWPPNTSYYDKVGKQLGDGTIVNTLDVRDTFAMDQCLNGVNAVYCDVSIDGTGSATSIKNLAEECSHTKNRPLVESALRAIWSNRGTIKWFAVKTFIPYGHLRDKPTYFNLFENHYEYRLVKCGKIHNDEYYIVGCYTGHSNVDPAYYIRQMLRICCLTNIGLSWRVRGAALGIRYPMLTPEAMDAQAHLDYDKLSFLHGRAAFKASVAELDLVSDILQHPAPQKLDPLKEEKDRLYEQTRKAAVDALAVREEKSRVWRSQVAVSQSMLIPLMPARDDTIPSAAGRYIRPDQLGAVSKALEESEAEEAARRAVVEAQQAMELKMQKFMAVKGKSPQLPVGLPSEENSREG